MTRTIRYDEFGIPSSAFPHVVEPATRLLVPEREEEASSVSVDVLPADPCCVLPGPRVPAELEKHDVIVDVRSLRKLRAVRSG